MKSWLLLVIGIGGIAAGTWLFWPEGSPSVEQAGSNDRATHSRAGPEDSSLEVRSKKPAATARSQTRDRETISKQETRPTPSDDSLSGPHKPTRIDRDSSDFFNNDDSSKSVIGGLVQDESGYPVSDIEILAEQIEDPLKDHLASESNPSGVRSVYSDLEGSFLFFNMKDGDYRISLAPIPGIAPAHALVRSGTLNVSLVMREIRDVWIHGTVSSAEGLPIEGVHIIAGPTIRNTRSGSEGEYGLYVSRQGDNAAHNIHFQHEDFRPQQIRLDPYELDDEASGYLLDVTMDPLRELTTVSGSLRDTKGAPVADKRLSIVTSQLRVLHSAQSDARGNFLFGSVEPGDDYQLMIRPGSGYRNVDINPLVVPDDGLTLDIVLEPSDKGAITGWMIDPYGNPIPGFSLTLYSTIATGQSANVVGDQQGYFSVEGFPVGGAMLRTHSYPLLSVHGIHVSPEPREPIAVVIDTGNHVLQGWIVDRAGRPVAASSITLDWESRNSRLLYHSTRRTAAGLDGSFHFTELGPGPHILQISAVGFKPVVQAIDVGAHPVEFLVELEETTE